jgi:DNA-binding transcriptional regulator PaaX
MAGAGILGIAVLAPNALQVLDKPLARYLNKLDEETRERELRQALYYMKRKGWITAPSRNYQHGLKLTSKGRKRLTEMELRDLSIDRPQKWDKKWRLVLYDIPEKYKLGRDALTSRLKSLDFYPLQRSVLVHPFPCRQAVEKITSAYNIERFVSYIETENIDQQKILVKKFQNLL